MAIQAFDPRGFLPSILGAVKDARGVEISQQNADTNEMQVRASAADAARRTALAEQQARVATDLAAKEEQRKQIEFQADMIKRQKEAEQLQIELLRFNAAEDMDMQIKKEGALALSKTRDLVEKKPEAVGRQYVSSAAKPTETTTPFSPFPTKNQSGLGLDYNNIAGAGPKHWTASGTSKRSGLTYRQNENGTTVEGKESSLRGGGFDPSKRPPISLTRPPEESTIAADKLNQERIEAAQKALDAVKGGTLMEKARARAALDSALEQGGPAATN